MNWFRTRPVAGKIRPASYGKAGRRVQTFLTAAAQSVMVLGLSAFCLGLVAATGQPVAATDRPVKLVLFGDSLTAGLGLSANHAFPARLDHALKAKGHAVDIVDAGVSGDTASAGLARLDWSVPEETDAVILELGANDALRGIDPKVTHQALDSILRRLKQRGVEVLLTGMRAPRNLGPDYVRAFDAIFPELAATHGVPLYPFFLDGVATDPKLNQGDGIHPNAEGVDIIVARILPKVEDLLIRVRAKRSS
jgi:acyl-CoA thioesterase I